MKKSKHGYTPSDNRSMPKRNPRSSNPTTNESRHQRDGFSTVRVGKSPQADLHDAVLHPRSLEPQNNHASPMVTQTHLATRNMIAVEWSSRLAQNENPDPSYNQKEANFPKRPPVVDRTQIRLPTNPAMRRPIKTTRSHHQKYHLSRQSVSANLPPSIIHHGKPLSWRWSCVTFLRISPKAQATSGPANLRTVISAFMRLRSRKGKHRSSHISKNMHAGRKKRSTLRLQKADPIFQ